MLGIESRRNAARAAMFQSLHDALITGKRCLADLGVTQPNQPGRRRSPLADLFGKWTRNETDEQVRRPLEELHWWQPSPRATRRWLLDTNIR